MSNRSYPPAYLRYLNARLSIFRKPVVLGISIFLVSIGIISWEFWLKPDNVTQEQNVKVAEKNPAKESKSSDTEVSEEDKSLVADIDNLPVLLNDFQQASLASNLSTTPIISPSEENQYFIEDAINKNNRDIQAKNTDNTNQNLTPAMVENPFVTQAENLLQSVTNNSDRQFISNNTINTVPQTTPLATNPSNYTNVLINTVQPSITQQNTYNNSVNPYIPITNNLSSQVSLPNNSMGYIQPAIANQQPNPYQNTNTIQTSQPIVVPVPGVYPVNSPIQNNSYPVQPTNPTVVNSNTPMVYGNYNGYGIQTPNQSTPSNISTPGQIQNPSTTRN